MKLPTFLTSLLRRLTRHYLVKHTTKGWILLHFHSWDYSTLIVKSIPYTTPDPFTHLPPGFKPTQLHFPCSISTTIQALPHSSQPSHLSIPESRFAQKM